MAQAVVQGVVQWLMDGSALLVGSALLNPVSGAWTPLPVSPDAQVAVGTQGRVALLTRAEGRVPEVQVLQNGKAILTASLPAGTPREGHWVHLLQGDSVYVHVSSNETGESRCWQVDGAGVRALPTCLEGSFVAIDGLLPAPNKGVVVASHGEGHPGVDWLTWDGTAYKPAKLPWTDLYPFGPLELLPRLDGSFDILTSCVLGPERPCLQKDGTGSDGLPARRYRWTPGKAPVLQAKGKQAESLPDPSSTRLAWIQGEKVCVGKPKAKAQCWAVPKKPETAAAPVRERKSLRLEPNELQWDDAAGTVTFSPDSNVMSSHYTHYVLDAASLKAVLGGKPTAPVTVDLEITGEETRRETPTDPKMPSPNGGFVITTVRAKVVFRTK